MVYLSTPRNNSPSPKVFFSHLNYLCNFRSWHSKLICMDYAIENTQGKWIRENLDRFRFMKWNRKTLADEIRMKTWFQIKLFPNFIQMKSILLSTSFPFSADVGLVSEYRAIIVMLMLPSVVNPAIWLLIKNKYKLSGVFIFTLLMLGCPSPFFL